MGKLKKNSRSSRHRKTPLGRKPGNASETTNPKDENLTRSKVLPLINKLSSSSPNDRSMALGAISVLAEDAKFRQLLLKEKLLKIVLEQLLSDSNSEIIVESFGLLRNFVIEEGYDVAVYLWRQGIWNTVQVNFDKAKQSFDSLKLGKVDKVESTLLFDYIENLISLVIGLGDSSDEIFEQVLEKIDPLMEFIKEILEYSIDGSNLKINVNLFNAILDLIYDFSSQSESFITSLTSKYELNFDSLANIVNSSSRFNELSRVYIQGIKLQLFESSLSSDEIISIFHSIINTIKDINIQEIRSITDAQTDDNTKPEDLTKESKKRIEARSKLQAIELSLEIITAIFEIIASSAKPAEEQLVLSLINDVTPVLLQLLPFEEFTSRSLTALNNLSWIFITTDLFNESWLPKTVEVWNTVVSHGKELEIEDKINSFGALWAILVVNLGGIEGSVSNEFITLTIEEFNKVLKDEEVETGAKEEYLIRLVGVLGNLAKSQGFVERNFIISSFFLNLIDSLPKNTTTSRLTVEILDIFYEIYQDSEFDYDLPNYVEKGYNAKLIELTPKIRASVKFIDRNVNPELKTKADEVFNNLGRFIKYKKSERRQ